MKKLTFGFLHVSTSFLFYAFVIIIFNSYIRYFFLIFWGFTLFFVFYFTLNQYFVHENSSSFLISFGCFTIRLNFYFNVFLAFSQFPLLFFFLYRLFWQQVHYNYFLLFLFHHNFSVFLYLPYFQFLCQLVPNISLLL